LNEKGMAIDKECNIVEAGLYSDGSIEPGNLDSFYQAIVDVTYN
jgi:hypothetical protein